MEREARFRIAILNGTRELAILPSGIREMTLFWGGKWVENVERESSCNLSEIVEQRAVVHFLQPLALSPTYHAVIGRDYGTSKCQKYTNYKRSFYVEIKEIYDRDRD